MYKFAISLNDDDYCLFSQHQAERSFSNKKRLLLLRIIIFVFAASALIVFLVGSNHPIPLIQNLSAPLLAFLGICSIVYLLVYAVRELWFIKWNTQRIKKYGKLPYNPEAELLFDNDFIIETSPEKVVKVRYSVVEMIDETDKALYIYIDLSQAFIIPLTVFANAAEQIQFVDYLRAKCPSTRQ